MYILYMLYILFLSKEHDEYSINIKFVKHLLKKGNNFIFFKKCFTNF